MTARRKSRFDRVLDVMQDESDMFQNNIKFSDRKKRKCIVAGRTPGLRRLIEQLPEKGDLFPGAYDLKVIVHAVDRVLTRERGSSFTIWFLRESASQISVSHPDVSAVIMERAGEYVRKRNVTSKDSADWQEDFLESADYWLLAGNLEERERTLLKASAYALQANRQQDLFRTRAQESLLPVWKLATDSREAGKSAEAVGIYEKLIVEHESIGEIENAAKASVICAHLYASSGNWRMVQERAEDTIRLGKLVEPLSHILFEGHILLGIALLNRNHKLYVSKAIGELDLAKEILQTGKECDVDDANRLNLLLGRVWGFECTRLFESYMTTNSEHLLRDAEVAARLCIAYLEELPNARASDLGNAYAMLSTIYTLQGETEYAEIYRNKAMNLGFDLSEE